MFPPAVHFPLRSMLGVVAVSPFLIAVYLNGLAPMPENLWLLGAIMTAIVAVHFIVGDWLGRQVKNMKVLLVCAILGVIGSIAQPAYMIYASGRDMDRMREDLEKQKLELGLQY